MNGAMAEPCASNSMPPSASDVMIIGSIQNFRRALRNLQSSPIKVIRHPSKLILETVGGRTGRVALDPVRLRPRLESPFHDVPPGHAHRKPDRRKHAIEDDAEHEWTDDAMEHFAEPHPDSIERRKPLGPDDREGGRHRGEPAHPRMDRAPAP